MTIAPPISKHWREEFVWVAQGKVGSTYKLTYNEEDMEPFGKLALREDSTCDICGACSRNRCTSTGATPGRGLARDATATTAGWTLLSLTSARSAAVTSWAGGATKQC